MELLSVAKAAELLHVGTDRIYQMIAYGKLPAIRTGKRGTLIPKRAVMRLARQRAES